MPTILGANSVSGYNVSNSIRFNSGDNPKLERTLVAATGEKVFSFSTWVKRSSIGGSQSNYLLYGVDGSSNSFNWYFRNDKLRLYENTAGSGGAYITTNQDFRDTHAWYHVLLVYNTNESTNTNRVKIYINGSQIDPSDLSVDNWPDEDYTNAEVVKNGNTMRVGASGSNSEDFDGYLAETNFIDGIAASPGDFGETNDNGVWVPKKYTATVYGNNGFFFEYKQTGTTANSSGAGADTSGEDHHFSWNGDTHDITTDTPTNIFATMSNLYSDKQQGGAITFSEGNCKIVTSYTDAAYSRYPQAYSSIAVTKGKWYFEMKPISGDVYNIGVFSPEDFASDSTTNPYGGYAATGCIYTEGGEVRQNDSSTGSMGTYDDGNIVGCALDMDNNAVYFHKDNTYINSGNPASGASKTGAFTLPTTGENGTPITLYGFTCGDEGAADVGTMSINFGNPPYTPSSIESDANGYGSFEFAPPSGYYALCTKNLAEYG